MLAHDERGSTGGVEEQERDRGLERESERKRERGREREGGREVCFIPAHVMQHYFVFPSLPYFCPHLKIHLFSSCLNRRMKRAAEEERENDSMSRRVTP